MWAFLSVGGLQKVFTLHYGGVNFESDLCREIEKGESLDPGLDDGHICVFRIPGGNCVMNSERKVRYLQTVSRTVQNRRRETLHSAKNL